MAILNKQLNNILKPINTNKSGTNVTSNTSTSTSTSTQYNPNVDYQAKINEAVSKGDTTSAKLYESLRNQKINDMNKAGTNTSNLQYTNNYGGGTVQATHNNQTYDIDLTKDYSTLINDAVSKNDYATAAQYEAQRNAKINYLNDNNANRYGSTVTNDYGGFKTVLDLPENWSSGLVNGNIYTRDEIGRMYNDAGSLVGDGYNANTNEFTFTDENDALNAMYSALKKEHGLENVSDDQAIAYLQNQGLLNRNLLNSYMTGTVGQYNDYVAEQKRIEEERMAVIAELEEQQRVQQEQLQQQLEQQRLEMEEYLKNLQQGGKNVGQGTEYTNFIRSLLRKNFIY